jgi:hypothetical protein
MLPLLVLVCAQKPEPTQRDLFGASVASVPDLDGGGKTDLAIGDPAWNDSKRDRGCVWIVSMETGRALKKIEPATAMRSFGWTLASAGDIDGRGTADLLVGTLCLASQPEQESAQVTVVTLEDGACLRTHQARARGMDAMWHSAGASPRAVSVGDWNADKCCDYAVAQPLDQREGAHGSVEVFSGKDGAVLQTWKGATEHAALAVSLAAIPDIDGDGLFELAAAARPETGALQEADRSTVLVFGSRSRETLHELCPPYPGLWFGASLTAVGDEDGDGKTDLWIRAPYGREGGAETGPGIEIWSTGTWKRIHRIQVPPCDGAPQALFGAALVPIADTDGRGTSGVFATSPYSWSNHCGVTTRNGFGPLTVLSTGDLMYSNIGISAVETADGDGDGARDLALSGVTIRGNMTGVVMIWSRTKLATIREITLASATAPPEKQAPKTK